MTTPPSLHRKGNLTERLKKLNDVPEEYSVGETFTNPRTTRRPGSRVEELRCPESMDHERPIVTHH